MAPRWNPGEMWKGEDAYVIGGGDSLRNFDWGSIRGRHTIACNSAYVLGSGLVEVLIFGDSVWWDKIGKQGLPTFGGLVVACCPKLWTRERPIPPWVLRMDRYSHTGFAPPGTGELGWAGNTGSAALNLALALGARRVFLLGFDMKLGTNGQANFHDVRYEPSNAAVYPRFLDEFHRMVFARSPHGLRDVYPNREVWNVSDCSELEVFPTLSLAEHFKEKA